MRVSERAKKPRRASERGSGRPVVRSFKETKKSEQECPSCVSVGIGWWMMHGGYFKICICRKFYHLSKPSKITFFQRRDSGLNFREK